uniref:Uncharacterized protein n=1 Tax=Melopsittacus undulatus TaxID=13146 RepID=A0A8V5FWL0_MELUD
MSAFQPAGRMLPVLYGSTTTCTAHVRCSCTPQSIAPPTLSSTTYPPKEIVWTKNKDKVAEWEEQNTTYFSSFRDRSFLNEENGCLTIFNLQNSDAEPEISCNDSGDTFVLKFPKPLYYTWKLNGIPPIVHHIPEVFIPKEDVGASTKAVYFIKFSQTEKSSEISLTQCLSGKKCNEPSMGYRGISAPPWTSIGCRGVFALVPGAPPLLLASSLILVPAELFLLHLLTPLSAVACQFLPFLK